jgi:hypothetical protein
MIELTSKRNHEPGPWLFLGFSLNQIQKEIIGATPASGGQGRFQNGNVPHPNRKFARKSVAQEGTRIGPAPPDAGI